MNVMTSWGIGALGVWVGVLLLMFGMTYIKNWKISHSELRGFSLPNGTIRSALALLIIGFYVIFIIFGYSFIFEIYKNTSDSLDDVSMIYQAILTAFTGLSGAVLGFYFGGRSSTPSPTAVESSTPSPTAVESSAPNTTVPEGSTSGPTAAESSTPSPAVSEGSKDPSSKNKDTPD